MPCLVYVKFIYLFISIFCSLYQIIVLLLSLFHPTVYPEIINREFELPDTIVQMKRQVKGLLLIK